MDLIPIADIAPLKLLLSSAVAYFASLTRIPDVPV